MKLSINLILFIFLFSCTNNISYKKSKISPTKEAGSKKVVYQITEDYKKHPIKCLMIFPFKFDTDNLSENKKEKIAETLRKLFYAHISPKGIRDIEIQRVNFLLKSKNENDFSKIARDEKCNSYLVGDITHYKFSSLGVYSQNLIGGNFQIYNSKSRKLVWRGSHISSSTKGQMPLSPIDVTIGVIVAMDNLTEEQNMKIMSNLARRISKTIPDYDLSPQDQFKIRENIQISKLNKKELSNVNKSKDLDEVMNIFKSGNYEYSLNKINQIDTNELDYDQRKIYHFYKSRILISLNKFDKADNEILEAIRLDKKNYKFYNTLGYLNSQRSSYERALAAYQMAIENNNKNGFAYFNSALIHMQQGNLETAINNFYSAGLSYHIQNSYLDVLSSINQLEKFSSQSAKDKVKKLKNLIN